MRVEGHTKENIVKGKIFSLMVIAAALFVSTGGAWASVLINIQANYYIPAVPDSTDPDGNFVAGTPESWTPAYTGGAVIGAAGDVWNQLTDTESVNPTDYLDAAGKSTGVTLTPGYHPIVPCSGFATGDFQGLMSAKL